MARRLSVGKKAVFVFVGFVILVAGFIGLYKYSDVLLPKGKTNESFAGAPINLKESKKQPIRVCVVTWPGYAGGEYFNNGFSANTESRFYKDYGLPVEFKVIDDFAASRDAWKSGEVDLLWITADSFPTEAANLKEYEPVVIMQADWSRGGDAIVVSRGINSVNDLRGKKVAVAFGTPSHTFLLWMLQAGDVKYKDINVVEAPSAVDAAAYFKAGQVDAAVVWSPDDQDAVNSVKGAKVLKSTKDASKIIADVFYVKRDFLNSRREDLANLVEGWLKGNAEINSSAEARAKAVKILSEGLNQPEEVMSNGLNNVRLATYGDNINFFDLKGNYSGVTGEDLYNKTGKMFNGIGLAPANLPPWRSITDTSILKAVNVSGRGHEAEGEATFSEPTRALETATASSTKGVTVSFASGSATLDDNAKRIIDLEFGDIAKNFANNRVRIEGNTDSQGPAQANRELSQRRAQAVADYLVSEYGFDRRRFVIVGHGPDNPVADNATEDGRRRNRRTDFQLLDQ